MDEQRMKDIAELQCRQYFDRYLERVFPAQIAALKDHTNNAVRLHNTDAAAHGGVERRLNKMTWMLLGAGAVVGSGLGTLIQAFVG